MVVTSISSLIGLILSIIEHKILFPSSIFFLMRLTLVIGSVNVVRELPVELVDDVPGIDGSSLGAHPPGLLILSQLIALCTRILWRGVMWQCVCYDPHGLHVWVMKQYVCYDLQCLHIWVMGQYMFVLIHLWVMGRYVCFDTFMSNGQYVFFYTFMSNGTVCLLRYIFE